MCGHEFAACLSVACVGRVCPETGCNCRLFHGKLSELSAPVSYVGSRVWKSFIYLEILPIKQLIAIILSRVIIRRRTR